MHGFCLLLLVVLTQSYIDPITGHCNDSLSLSVNLDVGDELKSLRRMLLNEQTMRIYLLRQLTDLRDANEQTQKTLIEIKNKDVRRGNQVAFHAYFGGNRQISWFSSGKTIVFDQVTLNTGSAYNSFTGIFVVPEDGVYVFNTVMVAFDKSCVVLQLRVNGNIKDISFPDAGNHNDRSTATTITVLQLRMGDKVYATSGYKGGNYIESSTNARSTFSGWKL